MAAIFRNGWLLVWNTHYPAEVFVVTQDDAIITTLRELLPGIRIGQSIDLNVHRESKTTAKESTAQRLAEHLKTLPPGRYSKQQIYSEVGIDKSNFGRAMKDANVAALVQAGVINFSLAYRGTVAMTK